MTRAMACLCVLASGCADDDGGPLRTYELDPSFGNGGVAEVVLSDVGDAHAFELASGNIILSAYAGLPRVACRLTAAGTLDTSFPMNGCVTLPALGPVAVDGDSLLVAGLDQMGTSLYRMQPDGTIAADAIPLYNTMRFPHTLTAAEGGFVVAGTTAPTPRVWTQHITPHAASADPVVLFDDAPWLSSVVIDQKRSTFVVRTDTSVSVLDTHGGTITKRTEVTGAMPLQPRDWCAARQDDGALLVCLEDSGVIRVSSSGLDATFGTDGVAQRSDPDTPAYAVLGVANHAFVMSDRLGLHHVLANGTNSQPIALPLSGAYVTSFTRLADGGFFAAGVHRGSGQGDAAFVARYVER